ncbi:MAG TPA: SMC family ATPase [Solirubrobacterales bacterium]|nr:SMC family ATPase [Solirubrobacterales bacterium]
MKLLRLEARNFRSFAEIDLDLNAPGVFSITGPNGAGKSTIFAAIEWALYGGGRGAGSQGVAREGVKREECCVTLEFEVGDHLLRVTRIDGKDAWLTDVASEERLAQTLSGTSREVAVRLGLTREMFRGTFYAPQKEVEALSSKDPRRRKDQLERLLGIRHLRRAVELAEADAREQGLVLEGLRREAPDVDELKAEVKRREKEARDAAPAVKRLKKEIAAHEAKLKETNREIDRLAVQLAEHASRQLEAERAEGDFKLKKETFEGRQGQLQAAVAAQAEQAELEAALEGGEQLESRERELDLLRQGHERRQALIARERESLAGLATATDALAGLGGAADERLERARARLREVREQRAEANAEGAHRERHRDALLGDGNGPGVCPVCHQEVEGAAEELVAELDAAIADARERRDSLAGELDRLEAAIEALERAEQQVAFVAERLAEAPDDGYDPAAHAEVRAALEKREEGMRRLAVVREQAASVELLEKQVEAQRKEAEQAAEAAVKLWEAANKEAPEPGAQEKMSAERDQLEEKLDEAREELETATRKASTESEAVAAATARLEGAKELGERIDEERRELELCGALAGSLEEYREEASRRARPMLETEASKLLRRITEATYPRIRLTEDYFLEIADGREFHLSRRFSGGEQDLAALCLRLALARTLAHQRGTEHSFVILDEVFSSQDVGRRRMLMDQLIELSRGEFQQIFVISHTEDIVDQCSLHIEVTRENGISRATGPTR